MEITKEIVRELLDYDPETGIFTWKRRARKWFKSDRSYNAFNSEYNGKEAGYISVGSLGYMDRRIGIFGRKYLSHRLAWLWMSDEPLPSQIDHEDRDATNNRWSNLKSSSRSLNAKNMSMYSTNTSGVTGVRMHQGKWVARFSHLGKEKHLGRFTTFQEAKDAVEGARGLYGFSKGHGKELAHYNTKEPAHVI